jgi:hypothetical protein
MTYGDILHNLREKSGAARFDNLLYIFDSLQDDAECKGMLGLINLLKYTGSPDIYEAPNRQNFNHIHDATSAKGHVLQIANMFAGISRRLRAIANNTDHMNTLATAANNLREDIRIDTSEEQSLVQHLQHLVEKHL